MRALITGARMFFAVDQIRKLGDAGHEVFAADTFRAAAIEQLEAWGERVGVPGYRLECTDVSGSRIVLMPPVRQ